MLRREDFTTEKIPAFTFHVTLHLNLNHYNNWAVAAAQE